MLEKEFEPEATEYGSEDQDKRHVQLADGSFFQVDRSMPLPPGSRVMDNSDEEEEYSVRAGGNRNQEDGGDTEELGSEDHAWGEPEEEIAEHRPSLEGNLGSFFQLWRYIGLLGSQSINPWVDVPIDEQSPDEDDQFARAQLNSPGVSEFFFKSFEAPLAFPPLLALARRVTTA